MLGGVKAMYTLARCRKFVPGFSLPAFKADALRLYEEVCQAIAADDKTLLRQVRGRQPIKWLLDGIFCLDLLCQERYGWHAGADCQTNLLGQDA